MSRRKYFTPKDVDQLIPRLEGIFAHILSCKAKAEALTGPSLALSKGSTEAYRAQSQVSFWLDAIEDDIDYIYRLGGNLKDVEAGLVDFPAEMQGEEVWLCWKKGETSVSFWHNLDEGFQQRQSLHPPQAPVLSH